MQERLHQFFSSNFMAPHGFCFMWLPEILWLHVLADSLIALSYFSIPLALWRFAKKRPDIPFNKIFILFATFITLCGLTHVFGIFVLWKPYYGIEGLLMLATGLVSAATAILVWKILPSAMTLPSPSELAVMNQKLSNAYEEIEKKVQERTSELEATNTELIMARQKADEASQAKSEFLANMSHEIRTPMNVVVGLSNILSNSENLSDKERKYVRTLQGSADALLSLLDDLLDIAKIETNQYRLEFAKFDLVKAVVEAVSIMEVRASEKGLDLTLRIHDSAMQGQYYVGDAKRLRQMLFNLCTNAIKFTEKGSINVTLGRQKGSDDRTDIVLVDVADTGIGIAPEKQGVIFEKFVQADNSINRKFGGTGLGLAITKTLVEQMGGAISVKSNIGEGSTFSLQIPMQRTESDDLDGKPSETSIAAFEAPVRNSAGKILLVEDYEPNALVASVFLETAGYQYEVASDGIEAVQKYKAGNVDLILMDVQMPGKNGWEATEEIRRYEAASGLAQVPIIGMTAHAYAVDFDRCVKAGMNDYITKPYGSDDLIGKIRKLLNN
jgi:signal transduction histidine kinase/CheY-like chemotaxis protein